MTEQLDEIRRSLAARTACLDRLIEQNGRMLTLLSRWLAARSGSSGEQEDAVVNEVRHFLEETL